MSELPPIFLTLINLRELIWSDEVENDKLVVEMIKGGGIAEALIPDLIILAKSTQDDGVKNALKKFEERLPLL